MSPTTDRRHPPPLLASSSSLPRPLFAPQPFRLLTALLLSIIIIIIIGTASVDAVIPKRGLYVSMDRDYGEEHPTQSNVLGNATKEDALLTYCVTRGFNALSMYNLHVVLPNRAPELRRFIVRARVDWGISVIEAIGGPSYRKWTLFNEYQRECVSEDEKFDGTVTEIEYWLQDEKNVTEMLDPVRYSKTLDPPGRMNPQFPWIIERYYYASYIGWPKPGQIKNEMAAELDFIYLHSYRTEPDSLFRVTEERLAEFFETSNLKAAIIFANTGLQYRKSEWFMGDWLADSTNHTVPVTEMTFYAEKFGAAYPGAANASRIIGYQWFDYYYGSLYDNSTTSNGPYLPPPNDDVRWSLIRLGSEWTSTAWCPSTASTACHARAAPNVQTWHDVVVVDLWEMHSANDVDALKWRNWTNGTSTASMPKRKVLCQFNAGVFESGTIDAGNFTASMYHTASSALPPPPLLSSPIRGDTVRWLRAHDPAIFGADGDEDAPAATILGALTWRLDRAAALGCDGVVLEGLDCWADANCRGASATRDEALVTHIDIVNRTAHQAHRRGLAVGFPTNESSVVDALHEWTDFVMAHNCHLESRCATYVPYLRVDKAVLRAEVGGAMPTSVPNCVDEQGLALGAYFSTSWATTDGRWTNCAAFNAPKRPVTTVVATAAMTAIAPPPTTTTTTPTPLASPAPAAPHTPVPTPAATPYTSPPRSPSAPQTQASPDESSGCGAACLGGLLGAAGAILFVGVVGAAILFALRRRAGDDAKAQPLVGAAGEDGAPKLTMPPPSVHAGAAAAVVVAAKKPSPKQLKRAPAATPSAARVAAADAVASSCSASGSGGAAVAEGGGPWTGAARANPFLVNVKGGAEPSGTRRALVEHAHSSNNTNLKHEAEDLEAIL